MSDMKWNVVGSKGDNYEVEVKGENWTCTCKAFTYSKDLPQSCKHIKKLQTETVKND